MTRIAAHPYVMMALNNAWANARLYHALEALPDGAFTAELPLARRLDLPGRSGSVWHGYLPGCFPG